MDDSWKHLAPIRSVARELRGANTDGRSRPLKVQCIAHEGAAGSLNVMLKLRDPMVNDGTPWRLCAARELVGAIVARALGLSVPNYALVLVTDEFIRATATDVIEGPRIAANPGWNFGSVIVDNVSVTIAPDRQAWEGAMTFDALALNGDRRDSHPNVLWDGTRLHLIDHGLMAPLWVPGVDGSVLFDAPKITQHAGYQVLRKAKSLFDSITINWCGLVKPKLFEWAVRQVPEGWWSSAERTELLEFLIQRERIADNQRWELMRVVQ